MNDGVHFSRELLYLILTKKTLTLLAAKLMDVFNIVDSSR